MNERNNNNSDVIKILIEKADISEIIGMTVSSSLEGESRDKGIGWFHYVYYDGSFHTNWGIIFTDICNGKKIITGVCINSISKFSLFGIKVKKTTYWEAEDILMEMGYEIFRVDGYMMLWKKENMLFDILSCEDGMIERCSVTVVCVKHKKYEE